MSTATERKEFSARLRQALARVSTSPGSPTVLARNFNTRYPWQSITVHAARKWLLGEAIPTQDKLRVIAEWLSVPVMWLRYGEGDPGPEFGMEAGAAAAYRPSASDLRLLADLKSLPEPERRLVMELIHVLLRPHDASEAPVSSPPRFMVTGEQLAAMSTGHE